MFKESSDTAVFNNCFLYLLDEFLENDKNLYPWTYFFDVSSKGYHVICINK